MGFLYFPYETTMISLGIPHHFIGQGPSGATSDAQLEIVGPGVGRVPGHGGLQLPHAAALAEVPAPNV